MKKLDLNKKTISALNKSEMSSIAGGICIVTCKRGSARGKDCCGSGTIDISLSGVDGPCTPAPTPEQPTPNPLEEIDKGLQQQP